MPALLTDLQKVHQQAPYQVATRQVWELWRDIRRLRMMSVKSVWEVWTNMVRFRKASKHLRHQAKMYKRQNLEHFLVSTAQCGLQHDIHLWYRRIRQFCPKDRHPKIHLRTKEGNPLSPQESIKALQDYFTALYHEPQHERPCTSPLRQLPFNEQQIEGALAALPATKALKPQTAPAILWKCCAGQLAPLIARAMQEAWVGDQVRTVDHWHTTMMALLPKPNKPAALPENLRPICLQHPVCKIAARLTTEQVRQQVYQSIRHLPIYAYMPHRSTTDCLLRAFRHCEAVQAMCATTTKAKKRKGQVAGGISLSIDLSKAFDKVNRRPLLQTLRTLLADEHITMLIRCMEGDYLIEHKGQSARIPATRGVKQGATDAPLLWNVILLALLRVLEQKLSLEWIQQHVTVYADDKLFLWTIHSQTELDRAIREIGIILETLQQLGFDTNLEKTTVMVKLAGQAARAALAKYHRRRPTGPVMQVQCPDLTRIELPMQASQSYLGAVLSYSSHRRLTLKRRVTAARVSSSTEAPPAQQDNQAGTLFPCAECKKVFLTRTALKHHRRSEHKMKCDDLIPFRPLRDAYSGSNQCNHCRITLDNRLNLRRHIETASCAQFNPDKPDGPSMATDQNLKRLADDGQITALIKAVAKHPLTWYHCAFCNQRLHARQITNHIYKEHGECKEPINAQLTAMIRQQHWQKQNGRGRKSSGKGKGKGKGKNTGKNQTPSRPSGVTGINHNGMENKPDMHQVLKNFATILLRHEASIQSLAVDREFMLFVTGGQGSPLPQMIMTSEDWHSKVGSEEGAQKPLKCIMVQTLMDTIIDRLVKVKTDLTRQQVLQGLGILDSELNWAYLQWSQKEQKQIVAQTDGLSMTDAEKHLKEAQQLLQLEGMLRRFTAFKALKFVQTPEKDPALVVPWRLELSLRHPQSFRLMEVLTKLCRNGVTQLAMTRMLVNNANMCYANAIVNGHLWSIHSLLEASSRGHTTDMRCDWGLFTHVLEWQPVRDHMSEWRGWGLQQDAGEFYDWLRTHLSEKHQPSVWIMLSKRTGVKTLQQGSILIPPLLDKRPGTLQEHVQAWSFGSDSYQALLQADRGLFMLLRDTCHDQRANVLVDPNHPFVLIPQIDMLSTADPPIMRWHKYRITAVLLRHGQTRETGHYTTLLFELGSPYVWLKNDSQPPSLGRYHSWYSDALYGIWLVPSSSNDLLSEGIDEPVAEGLDFDATGNLVQAVAPSNDVMSPEALESGINPYMTAHVRGGPLVDVCSPGQSTVVDGGLAPPHAAGSGARPESDDVVMERWRGPRQGMTTEDNTAHNEQGGSIGTPPQLRSRTEESSSKDCQPTTLGSVLLEVDNINKVASYKRPRSTGAPDDTDTKTSKPMPRKRSQLLTPSQRWQQQPLPAEAATLRCDARKAEESSPHCPMAPDKFASDADSRPPQPTLTMYWTSHRPLTKQAEGSSPQVPAKLFNSEKAHKLSERNAARKRLKRGHGAQQRPRFTGTKALGEAIGAMFGH
ncbi:unnamed protein product [Symbiodinium sp. CCMP2592]|nr:unnamed protein product [Symbiodinium sp. CCMP2592]